MRLRLLIILATCSLVAQLSFSANTQTPLAVEDAARTNDFAGRSPISFSPDGHWIAYTLASQSRKVGTEEDDRYYFYSRSGVSLEAKGSSAFVTNIDSGESRPLVAGDATSWGPSWSPDGRFVAFYSDRGGQVKLWIWDKNTKKLRSIPGLIPRALFQFETPLWTPDSRKILIRALPEGLTIESAADLLMPTSLPSANKQGARVAVYVSPKRDDAQHEAASTWSDRVWNLYLSDLVIVDVATGNIGRVARRCKTVSYFLSPDGTKLAYADFAGIEAAGSQQVIVDIVVTSLAQPQPRVVASRARMTYGRTVSWSPDSKWLAYVTSGYNASVERPTGDVYVVPSDGTGSPRKLTEEIHPDFGTNYYSQPLWDAGGRNIYCVGDFAVWEIPLRNGSPRRVTAAFDRDILEIVARNAAQVWSPDGGKSIYAAARDKKTKFVGFYRIDLASGQVRRMVEESKAYGSPLCFAMAVSSDGHSFAYTAQDIGHGADVWLTDADFRSTHRVTKLNPDLDKYAMGNSRFVEWTGEGGKQFSGALLLPTGYVEGKRYPLIVDVYCGRQSSDNVFRFGLTEKGVSNLQLLATRGYAVFSPDLTSAVGNPMRDIVDGVLPGIDKMIELGIADSARLGVTGRSYGGYSVLALIVQSTRFKAAVSRSGSGNLIADYTVMNKDGSAPLMAWAEEGQGRMGGTLWQYRDRYIENSPLFYLDRVTTPVLLVAGGQDTGVPRHLTEEIFVGLRRLGKEVTYAKYLTGGHTEGNFDYADAVDYANRMISWFDDHLKSP